MIDAERLREHVLRAAKEELKAQLAHERFTWICTYGKGGGLARMGHRPLAYDGPHDFVMREGTWYEPRPLTPGFPVGAPKACYGNAIALAAFAESRGAKYVEGYALSPEGVVHQHAWNADPIGQLVDTTWQNHGLAYLGVVFSVERADDATWNGDASVLDDFKRGWPVLEHPWEGEPPTLTWPASERLQAIRNSSQGYGISRRDFYTLLRGGQRRCG